MTVISKKRLMEYWSVHPQSKEGLEDWHRVMKKNTYTSLIEMQSSIIDVEYLKGHDRYCFNIHGNKYRLIARITWGVTVFVVEVLTHAEYTKKYVEKRSRK
jgi:mRNA interferase HigB